MILKYIKDKNIQWGHSLVVHGNFHFLVVLGSWQKESFTITTMF